MHRVAAIIMFDYFIIYACIAAVCLSFSLAPIGCFLLWRRQAFFGDVMAHSAMLGVAISLICGASSPLWGIILVCFVLSGFLAYGPRFFNLPSDTWLGLLSYTLMAVAFIVIRTLPRSQQNVEHFLFGDLLLLNRMDIITLIIMILIVALFFLLCWRKLILITLDPDWAHVEGISPSHMTFLFLMVLSCIVATTLPIIGALLVPGLLLLPGACAAQYATSPEGMIKRAIFMALVMLFSGIGCGLFMDWPIGPASVIAGFFLFILTRLAVSIQK